MISNETLAWLILGTALISAGLAYAMGANRLRERRRLERREEEG